jgi:hypothetical protein
MRHSFLLVCAIAPALLACSSSKSGAAAPPDVDAAVAFDGGAPDVGDPASNSDPQDLDPVNGDPALDIASSEIFFDNGAPWVRVTFYGAWPPSAQLSSWAGTVYLGTANTPIVTYSHLGSSGTESDEVDGIDEAKITYEKEPMGFRVRFADTTLTFDRYAIQSNLEKTAGGTQVQDSSGAFVITTKTQRPFGQ